MYQSELVLEPTTAVPEEVLVAMPEEVLITKDDHVSEQNTEEPDVSSSPDTIVTDSDDIEPVDTEALEIGSSSLSKLSSDSSYQSSPESDPLRGAITKLLKQNNGSISGLQQEKFGAETRDLHIHRINTTKISTRIIQGKSDQLLKNNSKHLPWTSEFQKCRHQSSENIVFDIVVGTPKSEKMLGDNSNAGTTLSTDTTISAYSIGFDKTVEHVTRMVPEFSGGIDEKLIFFINACELVAEITPVANRDIMLRTILTRIRGQAYEVIRYEEITSWEMLKTLLKNTCDKPINAAYLQIELFSAKQRYKESLIEYATRIRNLVQAVSEGSTQGKSTSDALAVKTNIREQALLVFLEGINDKIKVMVKSKNPSTLEQAIQIAIIEDKNITPSEVKANNHKYFNRAKGEAQKYNKGNCHVCGKYGHYARDCRFKNGSPKNEGGKPGMNKPTAYAYLICTYCSKKGHTIDKCYKKKNKDKRDKGESSNSGNETRPQE
ncbi:hypothetical protein QTP88_010524 [Uroleucon formosanum]